MLSWAPPQEMVGPLASSGYFSLDISGAEAKVTSITMLWVGSIPKAAVWAPSPPVSSMAESIRVTEQSVSISFSILHA